MREILFRGKSIEPSTEGKWWYGSLLVHGSCCYILPENPITPLGIVKYRVDPETVGQYTGMTDKNGTMIFEGDIVKENYKTHERIYSIVWDNDYFSLRAESEYTSYQLDELLLSHCEVIGNIHDNKDLIK